MPSHPPTDPAAPPHPRTFGDRLKRHLRNTFLTGIFAAVPVAVTIFVVFYIDAQTRVISEKLFGRGIPVVGILIAIAAIYLGGLVASSLIGRFFIRLIDKLLSRVPVLRDLYTAWKQIAFTPGGTEGMFAKVVLVPDETGQMLMMGFTSGVAIPGDERTLCVFVPAAPNPIQGRLYFVARERVKVLPLSAEEAFKVLLSTGNYLPGEIGASLRAAPASPAGSLVATPQAP